MGRLPWLCCRQGEGKGTSVLIVLSSLHHCVVAGREGEGASSLSSREREHRRSCVVERVRAHRCQAEAEGEGDHESTALSSLSSLERV